MKKGTGIKVLGFAATILGFCVTLFSDWVEDQKLEEMIDEKIDEALSDRVNNKETEEGA